MAASQDEIRRKATDTLLKEVFPETLGTAPLVTSTTDGGSKTFFCNHVIS